MNELMNVLFSIIGALIIGAAVHSAWLHTKLRELEDKEKLLESALYYYIDELRKQIRSK